MDTVSPGLQMRKSQNKVRVGADFSSDDDSYYLYDNEMGRMHFGQDAYEDESGLVGSGIP